MSMVESLIGLAGKIGAPLVKSILEDKIGAGNAALAETVIKTIAHNAGVVPSSLPHALEASPDVVSQAILNTEEMAPELVSLYERGIVHQLDMAKLEHGEAWWAWAWRPGMMYLFGLLWLYNIVILHVVNAIFKTALPETDLSLLFQLNALYMALYMGGHTIKDSMTKWVGRSRS